MGKGSVDFLSETAVFESSLCLKSFFLSCVNAQLWEAPPSRSEAARCRDHLSWGHSKRVLSLICSAVGSGCYCDQPVVRVFITLVPQTPNPRCAAPSSGYLPGRWRGDPSAAWVGRGTVLHAILAAKPSAPVGVYQVHLLWLSVPTCQAHL